MKLFEIKGKDNSEFKDVVFGHFTTRNLAENGCRLLPEKLRDKTLVTESNLLINVVKADGVVTDLTVEKTPEEILAARDENNYVEGYVQIDINDMVGCDYEEFLDIISEALVGSELLMDISYQVVGLAAVNELILKVSGDASEVIEDRD